MKYKITTGAIALLATSILTVATAWSQQDAANSVDEELLPTEVSVLQDLHFAGADGADVLVPPGTYLVELAPDSGLRLLPHSGDPFFVAAQQTSHEEEVDGALAVAKETGTDEYHVVLLLPDGIAHDAVATYSGIVTRDTDRQTLDASQINVARRSVLSQPVSSIGVTATVAPRPIATSAVAPWLNFVAEKKAYYVYPQFTVPTALEQLRRPIPDERYREFVSRRGASFRIADRAAPLTINVNAIVDAGGATLDRSNTVALIEIGRSPAFAGFLKDTLGLDQSSPYFISAFLVNSFAFDVPASQASGSENYRHDERVLVQVAAKDHRSTDLWLLESGKWKKLFSVQRPRSAMLDPQRELSRLSSA